jgi:hypothetical protein
MADRFVRAPERRIRRAALAIWRTEFGAPAPPGSLTGSALDPDGWCMRLARALAAGEPLPARPGTSRRSTPTPPCAPRWPSCAR